MLHARAAAFLATSGALLAVCTASFASCGTDVMEANGGAPTGGRGGGGTGLISFVSGVGGGMTCPDGGVPDVIEPDDASTGCEGLDGGVSYTNDVAHIFATCMGEACHATPSRASTVGLPAYECCNERLIIAPGNAAQSYLLDKIEGTARCVHTRMPLDLPPLSAADILTIQRWICEGAPDN